MRDDCKRTWSGSTTRSNGDTDKARRRIGGGPFAPPLDAAPATRSGYGAAATALVSSSQSPAPPPIPPWIANRLAHLDLNSIELNHGPIATYLEHLAHENTAKSKAILVKADTMADALGLDDEVLDGLLVGLGPE